MNVNYIFKLIYMWWTIIEIIQMSSWQIYLLNKLYFYTFRIYSGFNFTFGASKHVLKCR